MSDREIFAGSEVLADRDHDPVRCVNDGCGNRFDPSCEGWNGECDACSAVACDHFAGAHAGLELDCRACIAEPQAPDWLLVA